MVRDIKFISYDAGKSDFDSKDGEITIPTNLMQRPDGTWGPAPAPAARGKIPEGYDILAIHDAGTQTNVIATTAAPGAERMICWAEMSAAMAASGMHHIGSVAEIRCVEMSGDTVVIASAAGIVYLVWDGAGYILADMAEGVPTIEFGLRKAGTLSCTESFVIAGSSSAGSDTGAPGSGASRPHPSAETERADYSAAVGGIASAFSEAVDQQILARGYFHQPFFIRYALRLADGRHLLPSAPILMLPSVVPPILALNTSTDSEGRLTATTEFHSVKYFSLVYRIPDSLPSHMRPLIAAIDIFASPPIPTFDETSLTSGYITTYSAAIDASNTAGPRALRNQSRAEQEKIFEGHYADSADNFEAHYIGSEVLSRKVLMVQPNVNFRSRLCSEAEFYKIASVPYSATDGYTEAAIASTDFSMLRKGPALTDSPLSHHRLIATALRMHDDTLVAGVDSTMLPAPFPLKALGHAAASHSDSPAEITVYTRISGKVAKTSCRCSHNASSLADAIPRYVYYPDPGAFLMTVSDGSVLYALPLTPHDSLHGAFWWGGTDREYLPEPSAPAGFETPECEPCCELRTPAVIVSVPGNVFVFDPSSRTSFTRGLITSILPATKPPKSGAFGRHNLYAFTTAGIWMLEFAAGKVKSAQRISMLECTNPDAAVDAGEMAVVATGSGVFCLAGSQVERLPGVSEALRPVLYSLPHHKELLEEAGMTTDLTSEADFLDGCGLLYVERMGAIVVYNPHKDYVFVYGTDSKAWSVADASLRGKAAAPEGRYLAFADDGRLVEFGISGEPTDTLLLTRPIKLSSPMASHNIRSLELLGMFGRRNARFAVYGSRDMKKWHLTGSSECHCIADFDSTGYRMIRLCIAARLGEGEYIHGVRITADD